MKTAKILAILVLRSELLRRVILVLALCLMVWSGQLCEAAEMGTAFTYQGHLYDEGSPANGEYDFQFKLYDANVGGGQAGSDVNKPDVDVIDAYFTVELDFGSDVFDSNERWLEIGVRPGDQNDPCTYATLVPRQELTPVPYALYAKTAHPGHSLDAADGSPTNAVYVDSIGRVGIGTTSPYSKLEVNGSIRMNATTSPAPSIAMINNAGYEWLLRSQGDFFMIHDNTAGAERLRITGDGLVGIGTSPSAKLDVNGQVKITGGSPGVGKVLTSDAAGLASWQTPAAGGDNLGNHIATQNIRLNGHWLSGDGGNEGVFVSNTGNVGIGTSPAAKLDVNGDAIVSGDYKYSSAKTYYLNMPAVAFVTAVVSNGWSPSGFGYGYVGSGISPFRVWPRSPVYLPQGAEVTEFRCYYYDNDEAADLDIHARLETRSNTARVSSTMASVSDTSSGASNVIQNNFDNTISFATIDNQQNQYHAYLDWTPNVIGSSIRFYGCRIKYSLSTVSP